MPDKILMIDNTDFRYACLEVEKGKIIFYPANSPEWIKSFVRSLDNKTIPSAKTLNSIEEVRNLYKNKKTQ
jgi:hypothetical protein